MHQFLVLLVAMLASHEEPKNPQLQISKVPPLQLSLELERPLKWLRSASASSENAPQQSPRQESPRNRVLVQHARLDALDARDFGPKIVSNTP